MELAPYVTYKDINGVDISCNESILYIKCIFGQYSRQTILEFLGYTTQEMGLENSFDKSLKLQNNLGININKVLVHTRAILVLYQVFFETKDFSILNKNVKLDNNDHFKLFLFANQVLNKTDSPFEKLSSKKTTGSKEVKIEHLMATMRMYIGVITSFETNLIEELFLEFYKKLKNTQRFKEYNNVVQKNTSISINEFIEILENFKNNISIPNIFQIYEKFAVLNFTDISDYWENRIPKIRIPFDYRFFEQYPIIKKDNNYYPTSAILIFIGLIRKIYHVLSNDENTKVQFRGFWGKEIIEPVIKEYIVKIFETEDVKIIDKDSQRELGVELTDVMILNDDDIYLIEIKSGYMALSNRYSDNHNEFKNNFTEKYVFTSSGKHQLINQLDLFQEKYDKIVELYSLDKNKRYKVFSVSLVFDEALSMIGFKRYLGNIFNNYYLLKKPTYTKFLPYIYSNLFTFAELLTFERRIPDKKKRIHLFKSSFNYYDSFWDLLDDIKDRKIAIDGISTEDIK